VVSIYKVCKEFGKECLYLSAHNEQRDNNLWNNRLWSFLKAFTLNNFSSVFISGRPVITANSPTGIGFSLGNPVVHTSHQVSVELICSKSDCMIEATLTSAVLSVDSSGDITLSVLLAPYGDQL
jgi:hypothetical protein